ncbi:MAG: arginase family protein [Thermomicrobiales bacterium]
MRIHLVTVPYRYDERDSGLGLGPSALVAAGIATTLEKHGHTVDGPAIVTLPDDERVDGPVAANIGRLGAHTADAVAAARNDGAGVLVLAGDDTAAIGVIAGLQQAHGAATRIGLVWVDAHADFNTPETSYSGILAGMPVAILAGLAGPIWRGSAGLQATIPTDRIHILGPREVDEKEAALLRSTDVRLIPDAELGDAGHVGRVIEQLASQVDLVALHIDLDVLDPSLVPSSSTPSPDGLTLSEASDILASVLTTGKVATLTVAGLNPGAGARGTRSVESAHKLIDRALSRWRASGSDQA